MDAHLASPPFHDRSPFSNESLKRKTLDSNGNTGKRWREADEEASSLVPDSDSQGIDDGHGDDEDDFAATGSHCLLGDAINELDQTEKDELSLIDWSREYSFGFMALLCNCDYSE